jgi:hypothetical protein
MAWDIVEQKEEEVEKKTVVEKIGCLQWEFFSSSWRS